MDISILDEGHCSRSSLSSVAAMTTSLNLSDSNCLFHRDASISFHESETSLSTSTQSSRSHGSSSHSTSTPVSHLQECPLSSLPEMLPNDNSAYQSIENEESLLQSSSLTASLPSYAKQTVRGRWWRRSQDDQEDDGAGAVMKGTISYNVRSHPITGPHLQLEPSQVGHLSLSLCIIMNKSKTSKIMQRLALDPVVGLGHGLKEGLLVGSWLGQTGASQQLHARMLYMAFYTNLEA